jgi:oligoendopeptidase F
MEQWLKDQSGLEAMVNEDACWRQIRMTCDTENKALESAFNFLLPKFNHLFNPIVMH